MCIVKFVLFLVNQLALSHYNIHLRIVAYVYIYIVVTTKEFSENKVLNIVKRRAMTVKVTLTSARCDTVFHIRR